MAHVDRSSADRHRGGRLIVHVCCGWRRAEYPCEEALLRARRLAIGADRNDLRQLARGLLWLHRNGMDALMKQRSPSRSSAVEALRDGPAKSCFPKIQFNGADKFGPVTSLTSPEE
jgi:hypothetical protein